MAGKISELTVNNSPVGTDIIEYTSDPGGTPLTRSTTIAGLIANQGDYAEISTNATGVDQATINSSGYTKIDQFDTDGEASQSTPSHANDQITVGTTGVFLIMVGISFNGTGSETYTIALHRDGAEDPDTLIVRKLGTGGDVGRVAATHIESLTAGEVLDLRVKSGAGSGDSFQVESANFGIMRIV